MATQEQPGRKNSSTVEELLRLPYYFCVRGGRKCRGRAVVIRAQKSSSAVSDQQSVGSRHGCDTCVLGWDVKLRALCVVLKTIARIKDGKDPITHLFLILHVALGHSSVCLSLFVLCSCVSST